jgi:hypothetical protein
LEEWIEAKEYFNEVSDPDLVDYAIYLLNSTEKRYTYLLKLKKSENKNQFLNHHLEKHS